MIDAILEVENVVAGYGEMTILNGASFTAPRGAITTVIGPNGAGKSTAFKAIFGLLKSALRPHPLRRRDVTGATQRQLHRRRRLLHSARPKHLSRALGAPQHRTRRCVAAPPERCATARSGSRRRSTDFPALRAKADRQASTLSGGEQKQLEIARGLLLDPKLILIDEPSIGLSPLMVEQIFDMLKRPARPRRHAC